MASLTVLVGRSASGVARKTTAAAAAATATGPWPSPLGTKRWPLVCSRCHHSGTVSISITSSHLAPHSHGPGSCNRGRGGRRQQFSSSSVFRGTLDSDYQLRLRKARLKAAQVDTTKAADTSTEQADAQDAASSPTSQEAGGNAVMEDLPTNESSEQLLRIRHSCAHVMAMAVQKLHEDAQVHC